ncbi:MAG: hypothetical protein Q8M20_11905 [Rhodocyclaceae bacterium]|nr:hypothetical protein [Rhodocyclaceae bacterium]MDZ4214617.1 hypothetical protein [Rhodocyclaceae bacterium]
MKTVDDMITYLDQETSLIKDQYNIGQMDESVRLAEQALKRLAEMLRDADPADIEQMDR